MTSLEIRVLGPAGIEDHHAHLLRLDPAMRSLRLQITGDEHGIDAYCLRLMASQVVLVGAYLDGILRAGLEIIPDRTAREAEAIFTAEENFCTPAMRSMLVARLFDEARRYHLTRLTLRGLDDITALDRVAEVNFAEIQQGPPLQLVFAPAPARSAA